MRIKNKKGTTIVEASMIFPLVIAGVVSILYIIIGMYTSLSLQSSVHMALRNEAGQISETVFRYEPEAKSRTIFTAETVNDFKLEQGRLGLRAIVSIDIDRQYKIGKLFTRKISRTERGRSYIIDEAEFIRRVNLAKEVL